MAAHAMSLDSRLRGNDRTAMSAASFDDRIEIWRVRGFPKELTMGSFTRSHVSAQRSPIVAGAFHRTGAVEVWGRGTNRVIAMCRKHGTSPPRFEERQGFLTVTFKAQMVAGGAARVGSQVEPRVEWQSESSTSPVPVQYQSLEERILMLLKNGELPVSIISQGLGQSRVSGQLKVVLKRLLSNSFIAFTIPDKPNSRLQKYCLTEMGRRMLPGTTEPGKPRKAR